MNTTVVNVKIDYKTKQEAQEVAEKLGFSLSSLIKAYLKQLVRERRVSFEIPEKPTKYLLNALKRSKEDIKAGRVSPEFTKTKDAIVWLDNPKRKYENQIR